MNAHGFALRFVLWHSDRSCWTSKGWSSCLPIATVAEIRTLRSPPLLIAADHEGGCVQRFRDGFSAIPPMRSLGRHYDSDPEDALSMARSVGWLIAAELRAHLHSWMQRTGDFLIGRYESEIL